MTFKRKERAQRANKILSNRIDELQRKPYGALKVIAIALVIAVIVAALATCSNARAEDAEPPKALQCKRPMPDPFKIEPDVPGGAILYQVIKVYCYRGMAYARGLDAASSPVPAPMGKRCNMNRPFKLTDAYDS